MPYVDKQLTCIECNQEFTFSAGEQEKFDQLGFTNEPKRCAPCRAEKKRRQDGGGGRGYGGGGGGGRREFTDVVCAECGKPAQVPFKPRGDRPVYCSDCFGKQRR